MTKMNQEASFLRDKAEQLRGDKKARHELRKIYKQVCNTSSSTVLKVILDIRQTTVLKQAFDTFIRRK